MTVPRGNRGGTELLTGPRRTGRPSVVRLEYAALSHAYCLGNSTNPSRKGCCRGVLDRGPDGSSQDESRPALAAAARIVFPDDGAGSGGVWRQRGGGRMGGRSRRCRAVFGQCLAI